MPVFAFCGGLVVGFGDIARMLDRWLYKLARTVEVGYFYRLSDLIETPKSAYFLPYLTTTCLS